MTLVRFVWLCLALFLCLSLTDRARAQEPAPVASGSVPGRMTFAIVIGNNRSLGKRRPDLHYADDDAARYFEILQTMAPGRVALLADFDRDTRRLFPGVTAHAAPPRRASLDAAGARIAREVRAARRAGHETELYFVFAGHGDVAQGEGFIELADARFRSSELKAWLRAIPFTRAHVILDSCNSFFMLGVRKPGGRHFATSEDATRALAAQLPNVGVFLSTSAEGEAFEWSEIQSGIFSHVVRSGLLGAADADGDGLVSYVELAAFVDTATANVKNPNMRPHVFARGPGAADHTPIARLQSMAAVRRFELSDAGSLRLRLRDESGLPLLDAHTEQGRALRVVLPEAWARGATLERARGQAHPERFALPEAPGTLTLAALEAESPKSSGRGPDETFRTLFAQPFGPRALQSWMNDRKSRPPPVYGVSEEAKQRMALVLGEIARAERSRRVNESIGGIGFGALLTGAGIGVLHTDPDLSDSEKREARIIGGSLVGLGALFVLGGGGALFAPSLGEEAEREFRAALISGKDTEQAFAVADRRIQQMIMERTAERWAEGIIGGLIVVGTTTGFVLGEIDPPSDDHMARRLGWGGGFLAGSLMIGDALLTQTPAETLSTIWRDDPSLNQYQPSVTLGHDGAFLSLSGKF